ncbi:DegV family protein [Scatolibacter rhodanostii]|uniref:DegV family protein n=1 Tax=Scatolibacter rhodanostii TaxID=2014781 RepID=UPI000C076C88|nr:DegV family protein [Scatolibacter rhodanostii]
MSDYVIMTDSTCDLTQELATELGINVVPLSFIMDGKTYFGSLNQKTISTEDFYTKLKNGDKVSTAQVNSEEFVDHFEPVLKKGIDILYIAFSSGLSGTCQSALIAQKELAEKYPEQKIVVFDSLCASMGEGLLVYLANQKKEQGFSIEETYDWLKENFMKMAHWFTVDDLNHLKRGGRVSAGAAFIGTMLSIKPVLHVDNEGHLIPVKKVRGRKASLDALVKQMEDTAINPAEQIVFISHGNCLEDAEYVKTQIEEKMGVKEFKINVIGPVVGAHAGPGTIALFFLATER